jgi:hypothetical protein
MKDGFGLQASCLHPFCCGEISSNALLRIASLSAAEA